MLKCQPSDFSSHRGGLNLCRFEMNQGEAVDGLGIIYFHGSLQNGYCVFSESMVRLG